jgi:hypothetical protein
MSDSERLSQSTTFPIDPRIVQRPLAAKVAELFGFDPDRSDSELARELDLRIKWERSGRDTLLEEKAQLREELHGLRNKLSADHLLSSGKNLTLDEKNLTLDEVHELRHKVSSSEFMRLLQGRSEC